MKAFYEKREFEGGFPIFLTSVRNLSFVAHWHREIEVMYVYEGEIGVGINKEYRVLGKGAVSVCGGNDIHYYNSHGLNSEVAMIIFRPEAVVFKKPDIDGTDIRSFFYSPDAETAEDADFGQIIKQMTAENNKKKNLYGEFMELKLRELFLMVFRLCPEYFSLCANGVMEAREASLKPMQKALKYLEENYMEEITLEKASDTAGLSPFYFSRLFKTTTGTNYNSYLSRLRVEGAENLIRTTDENIIDIAYKTGFKSIRTFNRVFKNIKGHTPQAERNNNQGS